MDLTIAAADQERPYLRLISIGRSPARPLNPPQPDPVLTLDGLWIGTVGGARAVVLDGDYERVTIRYCNFDSAGWMPRQPHPPRFTAHPLASSRRWSSTRV